MNFTRPSLNLRKLPFVPDGASSDVVVWAPGADSNRGVLYDRHAVPAERYKMVGSFARNDSTIEPVAPAVFGTSVSPDGIQWSAVREEAGPGFGGFHGDPDDVCIKLDSHMNAFFDPARGKYYAYIRVQPPPSCLKEHPTTCLFHRIGVTSSDDFKTWSPPVQILVGDSEETNMTYAMVGWREADTYLGMVMVCASLRHLVCFAA